MCLWIINYQAGQIVHQPIIQLFGFDNLYHDTIQVNNKYTWPIVQGLFKIYIELQSGENLIHFSTSMSQLTFMIIYSSGETVPFTVRLSSVFVSNQTNSSIGHVPKQFLFLTKLVRSTLDEILYKQCGTRDSSLFQIENQFHQLKLCEDRFSSEQTTEEIFKEIYRQISTTNLIQDPSVKLVIHSTLASSLTFAYTYKNVTVINLPERTKDLPASFDDFYQMTDSTKIDSLFYIIGAYLHEMGHLLGLDHGHGNIDTIMSSSKDYIESGRDFFQVTPRSCSIVSNQQCSCYSTPIFNTSSSYVKGLLCKNSQYFQSSCRSDTHCLFTLQFARQRHRTEPTRCLCNGQFHFDLHHCQHLIEQFGLHTKSVNQSEL